MSVPFLNNFILVVSAWLVTIGAASVLTPKLPRKVHLPLHFFLNMLISLSNIALWPLGNVRIPLLMVLVFLPLAFLYRDSLLTKIKVHILLELCMLVLEIGLKIYSNRVLAVPFIRAHTPHRVFMSTSHAILFSGISMLIPIFWHRLKGPIRNRLVFFLVFIPVSLFALLHLVVTRGYESFSQHIGIYSMVFMAIAILMNLYAYITCQQAIAGAKTQDELEHYKGRQQLEYDYYKLAAEKAGEIRALHHDMSNLLQVAVAAGSEEAAPEYSRRLLGQIESKLAGANAVQYCQHPLANAVLAVQAEKAREQGIDVAVEARIPAQIPVDEIDLVSVLTNLCQNAIEANEKNPAHRRSITLKADQVQDYLVIRVTNPFDGVVKKNRHGELKTTKADGQNHGNGMKIIRSIARKYQGDVGINHEGQVFAVTVTMLCPQSIKTTPQM